jgi:RNA polymerase sigma-70 factor, ECF subfamily
MQGIGPEALLSLRADMLRFARLQLRDAETAEDLVQEAIEAALRESSAFAGRSTLKTWVFAILAQPDRRPPAPGVAHGDDVEPRR